jgi:CheY-like chemotaxis protein
MATQPAIMVVDDEEGIRDLLVEWLSDEGYPVVAVSDPAAALAQLDLDPQIELLLTDVVMPGGLNGFDLARRAQNLRPLLKVLFISAYSVAETVLQARAESPPMLRKPFRQEQLLIQVRRALDEPADPFA